MLLRHNPLMVAMVVLSLAPLKDMEHLQDNTAVPGMTVPDTAAPVMEAKAMVLLPLTNTLLSRATEDLHLLMVNNLLLLGANIPVNVMDTRQCIEATHKLG